jgi:hypothetical protein
MAQKAYPTSLRFGSNHLSPAFHGFSRRQTALFIQHIQIQSFIKHLRARTPVNQNKEKVIYSHDRINLNLQTVGWHIRSTFSIKKNKKPVPWTRQSILSVRPSRRRFFARIKIRSTSCLILKSWLDKKLRKQKTFKFSKVRFPKSMKIVKPKLKFKSKFSFKDKRKPFNNKTYISKAKS